MIKTIKYFLTVIHNYQIKRLEEAVFSIDQQAFVIVEKRPKIWVLFGTVLLSNLVFLSSIRTQKRKG